jgi:hypothetical protein
LTDHKIAGGGIGLLGQPKHVLANGGGNAGKKLAAGGLGHVNSFEKLQRAVVYNEREYNGNERWLISKRNKEQDELW